MDGLLIESISKQSFEQIEQFKNRLVESLKAADGLATATQRIKLPSDLKTQFSETEKQTGRTKKAVSDYEKQVRSTENAQKKLMQATNSLSFSQKRLQAETRLINKQRKDEVTLATNAATAYDRLQAKYNIASTRLKNLSAAGKESTNEFKRAQAVFARYEARLTSADRAVNSFRRNVGNYPKTLGAATASLRNLTSAFGLFSGVFLFAQLMRNAANSVRLFDASMQNIAGIMRTSRSEIKDLEEVIISVAGASVNTSTQVAQLAETLVTLGKTKEEIKDLLSPVNDLSIGLEATGAEAGEFLIQTLNAFGASSGEARQYADTIATIRTSTTLDFQKMRDSFQFITPIARILNRDLAWTGSVLGVLADNGLKAQSAGRLLGSSIQRLSKNGKTLQQGLDEINKAYESGIRENELISVANELFGTEAAKVGIILAKNSDLIETNADAIRANGGALDDLVNEQLKSLDSGLKILKSRWEEYILNANEAGGASDKLITVLKFLSDNLSTILNSVFAVLGAWALYRTAMTLGAVASRVQAAAIVQQRIATVALSGGLRGATRAVRLFAASLNVTPLGLFATGVGLVIAAVALLGKETKLTNKELQDSFNAFNKKSAKTRELTNEIQSLKERYITLSEEVKENKDKEEELESVMSRLVTLVPQAKEEFDEFGKTIGLNTDGVDDYIKELQELDELSKQNEIEKNTKKLADNRAALKKNLSVLKEGNIEDFKKLGLIQKQNGQLVKLQDVSLGNIATSRRVVALTTEEEVAFKKLTIQYRKNIKAAQDRLIVLRGGQTEAQKKAAADKKELENEKKKTFIIKELRAEIKAREKSIRDYLKNGAEKLSESDGEQIVKDREAIKTAQGRIDKILGRAKAEKVTKQAIEGTIDRFRQLIALEEEARDATATTAEEFLEFENKISQLKQEVSLLNGEYDKWLDTLSKPITESEALKGVVDQINGVSNLSDEMQRLIDTTQEVDLDQLELDFIDQDELARDAEALAKVQELIKGALVNLGGEFGIQSSTINSLFDVIKNGFEDAGQAAEAFGALATDVISQVATAQNARIEQDITSLNQEREIALSIASDNAQDRELIEQRFQERINALKTRQAQNERRAAIQSAVINTAVAVTKTFAELGFAAGIPAAAIIGALGAAQVAAIASQPLPQFEMGVTNFKGGSAIINEKRDEVVTTKDGRVMRPKGRNLLVDLPEGANVYSSERKFQNSLDRMLGSNDIDPVGASSMANPIILGKLKSEGLNAQELKSALMETLGSRPVIDLNIDKSGIRTMIRKQSTRTNILNNRVRAKSVNV